MRTYRVEFNITGFIYGQGIWECLDETAEVLAENSQEAIESCIEWMTDVDYQSDLSREYDDVKTEISSYAWRASEIKYDDEGYLCDYEWKVREAE